MTKNAITSLRPALSSFRSVFAYRQSNAVNLLAFVVIGLITGTGAIVFQFLCNAGVHFFLDALAGYRPPGPAGEPHLFSTTATPFNRWVLLFLPAAGGLISGWLVYTFAPEAEGHGTDAAIDAYHNKGGLIRARIPFIKTIASAITLTTGGSGGREGPIAQIGAGFGSFLATRLHLSERQRGHSSPFIGTAAAHHAGRRRSRRRRQYFPGATGRGPVRLGSALPQPGI